MTPEIRAFLDEPKALIITKANVRSRVHRRVYMDYIGVKRFDPNGTVIGEFRIVGLFTSTAYTRSTRTIPYLRRKVAAVLSARRLRRRTAIPARRWSTCWRPIRATNCSRSTRTRSTTSRSRSCSSRSGRACACWRGAIASTASSRCWCSCRATATAAAPAARSATSSPRSTTGASPPSIRSSRKARWCACTSSSAATKARRRTRTAPCWRRRSSAIVRTWADDLQEALTLAHEPARAQALLARYRDAFSDGYQEVYSPATAVGDIRVIEDLTSEKPVGIDFYRRLGEPETSASLKVWSAGRPIPLSERVPVLENMGFKVVDERTYRIDPAGPRAREIWFHDMLLERDDGGAIELEALAQRLEACFLAVIAAKPRTTASTRSCSPPGCRGATSRCCARSRASCGRPASPTRRTICGPRCASMPAIAVADQRAVPRQVRSTPRRSAQGARASG